jgi:hypothetical protein
MWVVVAAALAVGAIGCGGPAHPYVGGAIPTGAVVHRILNGASTIVNPGSQAGFGITSNSGSTFRLVWTGDAATSGSYRAFYGSVWTQGTFTSVTRGCFQSFCPLESDDVVSTAVQLANGQRIDFDASTTNGLDGFDFTVDDEPVYFDLIIDGGRYPDLVLFPATDNGGQVSRVASIPFGLTTF